MKPHIPSYSRLYFWALFILLAGIIASCTSTPASQPNSSITSIRVTMDNNYPPYAFLDEQGNMQGILVDEWKLWEERTGVKAEIIGLPWDQSLGGMKNGKYDVIDTIFYTDERAQTFDYTKPYANIDVHIFFPDNVSGIANAESLQGFRVAVKTGDANAEYLAQHGVTDLVYYDSYEEIVKAATDKKETIFVIDGPPALYFLYKYNIQDQFNYSEPLYGGQFHRAVKKGNEDLLALVNNGFEDISAAEYQQINARWFGANQSANIRRWMPYLEIGAVAVALLIAILVIFNHELQARVKDRTREVEEALSNLKASEARFRESIEFLPIPIGIADAAGNILEFNRTFTEYYGYTAKDVPTISEWMLRAYPNSEYRKKVVAQWDRDAADAIRLQSSTPLREYKITGKDAREHDVEIVMRTVGSLWVSSFAEITERKHAEKKLLESEERYRTLFEDSPIPLLEEDFSELKKYIDNLQENGVKDLRIYFQENPLEAQRCVGMVRIIDVNKAMLNWYQAKDKTDLQGKLRQLIDADDHERFTKELFALMESGNHYEIAISRRDRKSNPLHIIINGSIVPNYEETWERVLVSILDITQRKQAEEGLAKQLELLRGLRAIDQAIITNFDLPTNLNILIREVIAQLHVDAASISLFKDETLQFAAGQGFKTNAQTFSQLSLESGLTERVTRERLHIHIPNLQEMDHPSAPARIIEEEGFIAYYGVPLIVKGQLLGILELFHRTALNNEANWLTFLEALAGQAAITVNSAALFNDLQVSNENLQYAYDATLEGWSRALDLRDKETEGHTRRVTELTLKLARQFGFDEEQLIHVKRGSLLHDIGKMGIPDSILLKPDSLTAEEWIIMRKHTLYAYNLLSPIPYLQHALDIPYCHHENWDGSGYPHGLKGEQIPLAARIFAIVDAWDALTSDRPYRTAWKTEKVKEHLREESGARFDPRVVDIFLEMMENKDT